MSFNELLIQRRQRMDQVARIIRTVINKPLETPIDVEAQEFLTKYKIDRSRPIKVIKHACRAYDRKSQDLIGEDVIIALEYFPNHVKIENLIIVTDGQRNEYLKERRAYWQFNEFIFKDMTSSNIQDETKIKGTTAFNGCLQVLNPADFLQLIKCISF